MRTLTAALLLTLAATGGPTLCLAADSTPADSAAPAAAAVHPSHREMHQMQQSGSEEQRPADAAEDKSTEQDKADDDKNQEQEQEPAQNQGGAMSAPSQRGMHQQLREAMRNPASAAQ